MLYDCLTPANRLKLDQSVPNFYIAILALYRIALEFMDHLDGYGADLLHLVRDVSIIMTWKSIMVLINACELKRRTLQSQTTVLSL